MLLQLARVDILLLVIIITYDGDFFKRTTPYINSLVVQEQESSNSKSDSSGVITEFVTVTA